MANSTLTVTALSALGALALAFLGGISKRAGEDLWPVLRLKWRAILALGCWIVAMGMLAVGGFLFDSDVPATRRDIGHAMSLVAGAFIFSIFGIMMVIDRIVAAVERISKAIRLLQPT